MFKYLFPTLGQGDYVSAFGVELTFDPDTNGEPQCVDLQLQNDDILENDESFLIILSRPDNDAAVLLGLDTATVTISDDDSMLIYVIEEFM